MDEVKTFYLIAEKTERWTMNVRVPFWEYVANLFF